MSGMGERLIGMGKYRKSRAFSPEGFFECEGRGLKWLGEAQSQGGPRVVDVYDWGKDYLDIERVNACGPTIQAARDFGVALAHMHEAANDKPARVHGDLWSGNVMWTADSGDVEAVLIDPAAHGGHREEDLAMLDLFGMSYLTDILEGYQSAHPLKAGWQDRITLWQLYPIAGHCVFFGGGYVSQYRAMCRSLLK